MVGSFTAWSIPKRKDVAATVQQPDIGGSAHFVGFDRAADVDIGRLLRAAWRRRWLIFFTTAAITATGCGAALLMTPRYTGEVALLLTVKDSADDHTMSGMNGGISSRDTAEVSSAIDVLTSADTIRQVVQSLGLENDPEFNPLLRPDSSAIDGVATAFLRMIGRDGGTQAASNTADERAAYTEANVRKRLSVTNDGKSYTINVSFTSTDPQTAARVANAVADTYLIKDMGARGSVLERLANLLDDRSQSLRERVFKTEAAVAAYKDKHSIVDIGNNQTLANDALTKLNTELIAAKAERVQAEGMLAKLNDFARVQSREAAAKVAGAAPNLIELVNRRAEVQAQAAEMSATFGAMWPRVVEVKSKLAELDRQVSQEVDHSMAGLQARLSVARAREIDVERNMGELTASSRDTANASGELRRLVADAETARTLYQSFLETAGKAAVASYALAGSAHVVAAAVPPFFPSFPNMPIVFAISLFCGLLAGTGTGLALEATKRGLHTPEEAQSSTSLPTLGLVPYMSRRVRRGAHAARVLSVAVLDAPRGADAEALRSIVVRLTSPGISEEAAKVVMVTSALPEEGKTSFTVSLGRLVAAAGRRVLFIECDMRRPTLCSALGIQETVGLADVLERKAAVEDVFRVDEASGMSFISSGARPTYPAEQLASIAMRSLIAASRRHFDLVILDAPPVGVVSDALILAPVVDSVALVVQWARTPRQTVDIALNKLTSVGARTAGIVLTQVRLKRLKGYGSAYAYTANARSYRDLNAPG